MKTLIAFVAGAIAGAGAAYYKLRSDFDAKSQKDLNDMREYYKNKYPEETNDKTASKDETPKAAEKERKNYEEVSSIYRSSEKSDRDYTKCHGTSASHAKPVTAATPKKDIRVIKPDEYGEIDDYDQLELTYYADDILTDSQDKPIENPELYIGKSSLAHFGEYEEDSVFVRNDNLKAYVQILREIKTYAEVLEERPYLKED